MASKLRERYTWSASRSPITMRFLPPLLICLFGIQPLAHAEGGCPAGTVPEGGPGTSSCRPLPGSGQPGAQASSGPRSVTYIERWGAVALDAQYTGNIGASRDKSSRAEAETIAMANCISLGSKKCELVSAYSNGCVALAKSDTHYSVASARKSSEAESNVLGLCADTSCKVVYSRCSMAVPIR
ncbi:DUF4189 domain-containing protein [Variovorax sp. W6]|uniref:DUF4189 domain-containing protein n=1 Tax=Variovorax sp. W6 TaxID=3093895 RepID=UPI003D8044C4